MSQNQNSSTAIEMAVNADGRLIEVFGREAWMLDMLLKRGERGITTVDAPGARLSQYVMKLRGYGIVIETIREPHKGPFSGHHGRYVLRTPLSVVSMVRAGEGSHAA